MRVTRRSRYALIAVVLLVAAGWWRHGASAGDDPAATHATGPRAREVGTGLNDAFAHMRSRGARIDWAAPRASGDVVITGKVVDQGTTTPVPDVEVVFRSPAGEETTTAGPDGAYQITVPAGIYRAFVRGDGVLSVGTQDHVRLPGLPPPDTAGVPDENLMSLVVASADARDVDLQVARGGTIHGKVVDKNHRAIAGVVVVARNGSQRPALGTDVAESDANGEFDLELPAGEYELVATHARYAGLTSSRVVVVEPGDKQQTEVEMTAGCVIAGRVVDAAGHPAGDGAIEQQLGSSLVEFSPAGRIEADGTFRWVTTDEATVELRAWPWKAPPSRAMTFACRDGARFDGVVFQLPDQRPDLDGVLVDEHGQPVPFAYLDIDALDEGGQGQQERTDADGHWQVFSLAPGHYAVTAKSDGHGVVHAAVTAPAHDVRLTLGGTGRIEGTTTLLVDGSFELITGSCVTGTSEYDTVPLAPQPRLVPVTGGHFSIEGIPACTLIGVASWHEDTTPFSVEVPAGGTAHVELDLGPPRNKHVHGVVRDASNRPVPHAEVMAMRGGQEATATTDAVGRYALDTLSGANLFVSEGGRSGGAAVSSSKAGDEEVDVEISEPAPDEDFVGEPEELSQEPAQPSIE